LVQNYGRHKTRRSYISTYVHLILERLLDSIKDSGTGVSVHGHKNLKFVDNIDLLQVERDKPQENLKQISEAGEVAGLKINVQKNQDYGVWTRGHQKGTNNWEHTN